MTGTKESVEPFLATSSGLIAVLAVGTIGLQIDFRLDKTDGLAPSIDGFMPLKGWPKARFSRARLTTN